MSDRYLDEFIEEKCPICGNEEIELVSSADKDMYRVECRICDYSTAWYDKKEEALRACKIEKITSDIAFHENRIEMHKSAIKRLKKEKSILMMNEKQVKVDDTIGENIKHYDDDKFRVIVKKVKIDDFESPEEV